jgi:hypothetical protein
MRTQLLAAAAALTLSLTGAATASATTFNASPGATRTQAPCTVAQPCTLTFAVGQAFSGDDVALTAGTYDYFAADPLEVRPGVTLHGAPGARATIEQSAPYRDCDGCPTLALRAGSVLRDVDVIQVEGGGAVEAPADATIERSALRGRSNALTFKDTNAGATPAGVREVLAVAADGTAIAALPGGPTRLLENVTAIGQGANGKGISVVSETGQDATVEAVNTIARGGVYDVEAYAKPFGSPQGAGQDDVASLTLRYSNYRGDHANRQESDPAWSNARIDGFDHNQPDDPKFASATDFHLAGGSPAIDAGRGSALFGTLDLDGNARTYGAKPDIGAYEWRPAPPPSDGGTTDPGMTDPGAGGQQQQTPSPDQPQQPDQPKQPQLPGAASLVIAKQTVTVKKNVAAVKVSCPAGTATCTGTLALTSGKVKVGSARYTVASGKRGVVKVKLAKAARKLIARKRTLKATANASSAKAKITLKLPVRKR